MSIVRLDGETLTVAKIVDIARHGAKVEIDNRARDEIVRVRRYIDDHWLIEGAPPTYGFNTGVGKLKDYAIIAGGQRPLSAQHRAVALLRASAIRHRRTSCAR